MGMMSQTAAALVGKIPFPLWGLRFRVYGLTGDCRFGGGQLRVLYAGTQPFSQYFKSVTFSEPPKEEFFGMYNIYDLARARQGSCWDLELFRSHRNFANSGLFPTGYFVPEWISGTSSLSEQGNCEKVSRSRKRDRRLMLKNDISYSVTTDAGDLEHFYDAMYLPHMRQKHGESAFLMSREQMMSKVSGASGELLVIRMGARVVGGSFIVREHGRPRLYSQGILGNEKELMRRGVGTAIYLCSLDHLTDRGFDDVHMGWSRAFLGDGSLYFKQRFGFRVADTSEIGHFLKCPDPSEAGREWLRHMGVVHYRRGETRALLFGDALSGDSDSVFRQKRIQAEALGLNAFDIVAPNQAGAGNLVESGRRKVGPVRIENR